MTHAIYSPSAAHRWLRCPGSVVLEDGLPDTSSVYAAEGTAAHQVAAAILSSTPASRLLGERISVGEHHTVLVDAAMVEHGQTYADIVQSLPGYRLVEQRVSLPLGTTEPAYGTIDALVLDGAVLHVVDYKFGRGEQVEAEDNDQLLLYAAGALYDYGAVFADVERVHLMVVQPRAGGVREAVYTVEELEDYKRGAKVAVDRVMAARQAADVGPYLNPGETQCRWCKAKASCPALRDRVAAEIGLDFDDLTAPLPAEARQPHALAQAMGAVDLIEAWCTSVREEVRRRLLDGEGVPGWKLVEGRRGARKWSDEDAAKALLVETLGSEAWERKLISPTTAEKKLKKAPAWQAVAGLVTQPEGAPVVAPADDKRAAWSPAAGFDIIEGDVT